MSFKTLIHNPCSWCWWGASEFILVTHSAAIGTSSPLNNQWTNGVHLSVLNSPKTADLCHKETLKSLCSVSWLHCQLSLQQGQPRYPLKDSNRNCYHNETDNLATYMNLSSDSRRTRTSRRRWIRAISTSISSGDMVLSAMDTSEWPKRQRDVTYSKNEYGQRKTTGDFKTGETN